MRTAVMVRVGEDLKDKTQKTQKTQSRKQT